MNVLLMLITAVLLVGLSYMLNDRPSCDSKCTVETEAVEWGKDRKEEAGQNAAESRAEYDDGRMQIAIDDYERNVEYYDN